MTKTTRRRRAKRPEPPPALWLLAPLLLALPLIGVLVVPLSPAEAEMWQRAVTLRPGPAPLADGVAALSLRVFGDTLLALRVPGVAALALLLLILWDDARRWRLAVLASAPLLVWGALAEPMALAAAVPLAVMARLADGALAEKVTKKAPMRAGPWVLAGAAGSVAALLDPAGVVALAVILLALGAGPRPRGAVFAAAGAVPLLLALALWWAATDPPAVPPMPLSAVALALLGLGPLVLWALWPVDGAWRARAALLLIGITVAAALLGRGTMLFPMLALVLLVPVAAARIETVRAAWAAAMTPVFAIGLIGVSGLYALYGAGLPAAADPFASDRMRPAFCSEILLALEEEGAVALAAQQTEPLRPCLWQGNLAETPILAPTVGALATAPGPVLLVAFWPDDGAALARRLGGAERIGERAVPGHLDVEQRFTLWRIEQP
ncbi:hypothetical protein [Pontivivens ytuae]|uniref:Uncharacterized protein n=1 Tax=Pontivivens ytuae TaxID=2789856 RepID=A0A7S9QD60_9RHOB|nr:hypothetical protein [Pontivivens ytuae]QPH54545.1 hypothetical protein I0K15_01825 [Pontivivens ytuae]